MKSSIEKTLKEDNQGVSEPIDDMLAKDLDRFPSLRDPMAKPYYWPTNPRFQSTSSQPETTDLDMSLLYNASRFFPSDKDRLNISKSNTEMPLLFYKLPPSVQILFKNKEELTNPIQKLLEYAGLQDEKNILQADLIDALLKLNVIIRVVDIVILNVISNLSQSGEQKPESQTDLVI